MEKIMPLDLLSSIKDARSSEAVEELFKVIEKAAGTEDTPGDAPDDLRASISVENLREDEIGHCPETVKEIIRKNFPKERNGYLVVPKVIDD